MKEMLLLHTAENSNTVTVIAMSCYHQIVQMSQHEIEIDLHYISSRVGLYQKNRSKRIETQKTPWFLFTKYDMQGLFL